MTSACNGLNTGGGRGGVTWRTSARWLVQASQQPSAHTTSTVQPAALILGSPDWMAPLANDRQWGNTHLFWRFSARVSMACSSNPWG